MARTFFAALALACLSVSALVAADCSSGPTAVKELYSKCGLGTECSLYYEAPDSCVDEYQVSWALISEPSIVVGSLTTPDLACTIPDLTLGSKYSVKVKSYSYGCDCGAETTLDLEPSHACEPLPPSHVRGLSVTATQDEMTVCWTAPSNGGCVDEYRVMLGHDGIDMEGWTKEISTGECTTFKSLAPATEYHCAVQAYSKHFDGGALKWTVAKTQDKHEEWTCAPVPSVYPLCGAAKLGLCKALDCKKQALYGKCEEDFMRHIDYETKTITQYCADYCPCPEAPAFPVQRADSKWTSTTSSAKVSPYTDKSEDMCCKVNSYSSSPDVKEYSCYSPFGKTVKMGVSITKTEDGIRASAKASVVSTPAKHEEYEEPRPTTYTKHYAPKAYGWNAESRFGL